MADRLTVRHFLEVIADLYLPRQLKSQGDAVAVGAARCRRSGGERTALRLSSSVCGASACSPMSPDLSASTLSLSRALSLSSALSLVGMSLLAFSAVVLRDSVRCPPPAADFSRMSPASCLMISAMLRASFPVADGIKNGTAHVGQSLEICCFAIIDNTILL